MCSAYERNQQRSIVWLKRWIWVYFWLLIFEGVLRKWIIPSLSGELLIIRDPIAVIIYFQAYRCRKFSMKRMWPFALLSVEIVLLCCAQIVFGINTPLIALYGIRSYVLHLPLVFVMAETLKVEDIRRLGRWLLVLSVPMTILILFQYRAGAGGWLNAGAGEGAAQINAAGGHIRPAGTFSYGVGAGCLAVLTASFVLDAVTRRGTYPNWLVYPALFAVIASIPMLGSRTVLFTMVALAFFMLLSGAIRTERLAGLVKLTGVLLLLGLMAIQLPFFNDAVATFEQRWEGAARAEGDVADVLNSRVLGGLELGLASASDTPWLGRGVGMGSNFAAMLLTGAPSFLLSETEWGRVVMEFGPVCGLLFMGGRVLLAVFIVLQARRALSRGAALSWLLVPAVVPLLLVTAMEQPTFLGFMAFGSGICLAAARIPFAQKLTKRQIA